MCISHATILASYGLMLPVTYLLGYFCTSSSSNMMFKINAVFLPDNLGEDCPVFDNLFEFCQIYAGGTIGKFIPDNCNTNQALCLC